MDTDLIAPAARGLSLMGRPLPDFTDPVRSPLGTTPPRRVNSVRRTMSVDATWPGGVDQGGHYLGRCRDILTLDAMAAPELIDEAEARVVAMGRQILSISATPKPQNLQRLIGVRAGAYLRTALAELIADEKAAGTPLYLILDDMAGATLVSRWAFAQWHEDWMKTAAAQSGRPKMEGVCIGFRPGSSALASDGSPGHMANSSRVVPLPNPDDPDGWHALPREDGVHFRRARWIDVWREGDEIAVQSLFQDSSSTPDGVDRCAIHEYRLDARISGQGRVLSLDATAGTLPYAACRVAHMNNEVLIGTPVRELRETVLKKLKLSSGCTHLNDTLRALAEVPILADRLARI